jgi:hypothetical protein
MGAWRALRNAGGERPVDIARRKSHPHLWSILEPAYRQNVADVVLNPIQEHFHALIRQRANDLVREHALRLPELEPMLEFHPRGFWFPVPGMYGGFSYRLVETGNNAKLISESWCRVSGGSGQRHEITVDGCRLVDEGFV